MPATQGLVSITVPFLNGERFLREAIESILCQTYTSWELKLVDDGSNDGSTGIAKQYAARFPEKIHYLDHPGHLNLGLPASRNHGLRNSSGEFLAFLDSDDVWLPDKLEQQVALMHAHPTAGLIYGHFIYWYSWDTSGHNNQADQIHPVAPPGKLYMPPFLLTSCYPLGWYGAPPPSGYMLRRNVIDLVGGFEESFSPRSFSLCEDLAFLTKVYLHVPVFVGDYCGEKYRCHSESMSSQAAAAGRMNAEHEFFFRWLWSYLIREHIWDFLIWKVVLRRSWKYWLPISPRTAERMRRLWRWINGEPRQR